LSDAAANAQSGPVNLVGKPRTKRRTFGFPTELAEVPLLLPGRDSDIRAGFDLMCEQLGIRYRRWWCRTRCAAGS
jgi:hypothetical protein